jgi:S-adenosylmethionine hydrolase
MSRIITLTTDFGLEDEFAGVMKGVILSRAPGVTIVDLSHAIERQNIRQAALLIRSAYRFFPAGTIHLVVVDPGVGSDRKLILLEADNHLFLAPDNGLLGMLFEPDHFQAAHEIECPQFYLTSQSTTFHGRDILAPVAAQLAAGLNPALVGSVIEVQNLIKIEFAAPIFDGNRSMITGEITGSDHFGNLQTNIGKEMIDNLAGKSSNAVRITVKGKSINGILDAFADKAPGEMLALVGSRGVLEIAVNRGNASDQLCAGVGDEVRVEKLVC